VVAKTGAGAVAPIKECAPMQRVKIMLVDDDRDWVESMADLLEAYGYDVEIAFDGGAALHRLRERDYDIAFMDVRMPVMNGADSFLAIHRDKPGAKVVMMTGQQELAAQALEAGALGLLEKPFSFETMLAFVETHI
jgi:DNA-binding NtrC family response regulator